MSTRAIWGEVTPECHDYMCAYPVLMGRLCPDPKCKAIPCSDDNSCAHVERQANYESTLTLDKAYVKYAPMTHVIVIPSILSSRIT